MSDKPPAQIIDLSAAFKQRLTGEVAAPELCAKCGGTWEEHSTKRHHSFVFKTSDAEDACPNCGAHWPRVMKDSLVEKLATSVERAAVVKYLRVCGFGSGSIHWRLADDIEKGEHRK